MPDEKLNTVLCKESRTYVNQAGDRNITLLRLLGKRPPMWWVMFAFGLKFGYVIRRMGLKVTRFDQGTFEYKEPAKLFKKRE